MYKKLHVILCLLFILGACATPTPEPTPTSPPVPTPVPSPTPEWNRAGWNIAWHDEFDGTELNLKNWTFDLGGGGWGNQEWEAYTNRPENVRVEDGMLVIEAREEEATVSGRPYSSAASKRRDYRPGNTGASKRVLSSLMGTAFGRPFGCLEKISAAQAGRAPERSIS